ncbi:hypothetical protein HAX54_053370, partial [Datura stramonium]|nr:hypothetical protein [Datura stramonium]
YKRRTSVDHGSQTVGCEWEEVKDRKLAILFLPGMQYKRKPLMANQARGYTVDVVSVAFL